MLTRLGTLVAHRPLLVLTTWLVVTVAGLAVALTPVTGASLFDRLGSGESGVPGSESSEGAQLLSDGATSGGSVVLLVTGLAPTDADRAALATARTRVAGLPGVRAVLDPVSLAGGANPRAAARLTAPDGDGFLVIASLLPGLDDAQVSGTEHVVDDQLARLGTRLVTGHPGAEAQVGSNGLINGAITAQAAQDLARGALVALPVALLVMLLVFGGFLAAATPLLGAVASLGAGMGALLGLSVLLDVHVTAVDVVACLGLGLTVDYGMLVVSRFREQLAAGGADDDRDVTGTVVRTVETAGRTVGFSALTIAAACSGLLVVGVPTLRATGVASIAVVLLALLTAVTLVPALLRLVGTRAVPLPGRRPRWLAALLRRTADVTPEDGGLSRLAGRVQRRPWWVLGGTVVVLLVLSAPAAGMNLRSSGIELLPASSPQRTFLSTLTAQYPSTVAPQLKVVASTDEAHADAFAATLAALPGVAGITGPSPVGASYVIGLMVDGADPGGSVATSTVHRVRALSPGFPTWTIGQAAAQVDTAHAVRAGLGWAAAIVVLVTVAVLFMMTGSLVVPLQALVTNALSLAAALGLLTWVFQDATRASWLGATSTGGVETSVVAVVLTFAFGLSTDYEVFLLARVAELRDAGLPTELAIRRGLQRSGRIVTAAATVVVVVLVGFAGGQLLPIKQIAFALAVAVVLDVTVVRLLLVPAVMTLLGRWNWWAPAPLVRVRARVLEGRG